MTAWKKIIKNRIGTRAIGFGAKIESKREEDLGRYWPRCCPRICSNMGSYLSLSAGCR